MGWGYYEMWQHIDRETCRNHYNSQLQPYAIRWYPQRGELAVYFLYTESIERVAANDPRPHCSTCRRELLAANTKTGRIELFGRRIR